VHKAFKVSLERRGNLALKDRRGRKAHPERRAIKATLELRGKPVLQARRVLKVGPARKARLQPLISELSRVIIR
jgi:hypothetical protein